MTGPLTDLVVRAGAVLVPRRLRDVWRREWQGELSYGWQQLGSRPALAGRWQLTGRASSALAHAVWLRAQEITVEYFRQDVRFAFRLLRRHPGASLVAVVTLALGIGANTAIFSLVNSVLLKPLPVAGLDRLVVVREDLPTLSLLGADLAPIESLDLAERKDLFSAVTGIRSGERTLTGDGQPARVGVAATVGDFAAVFGLRPAAGRLYGVDDSTPGQSRVAVVSHGLWQQLSAGDPAFIGRRIVLDDVPLEVIGVMPRGFRYPRNADVWVPFTMTEAWRANRGSLFMTTVGRLASGVGEAQLAAGLGGEVARWNEAYSSGGVGKELTSTPFIGDLAGPLRLILFVLLGAVVFVLMIAAANVASLQLVRTVGRAREIAVRSAIGAGPGRIFRQFLIESALLSAAGGALGLALGVGALSLLGRLAPAADLRLSGVSLDAGVLAFTAGVTMLAAVIFGTAPALRGARVSPEGALRDQGRGASTSLSGHRLLKASIVVQVALALVLLLGSGLMIKTLSRLLAADPGFRAAGLVTAQIAIPAATYASIEQRRLFFEDVLARVRALPNVESAALVTGLPFAGSNDSSPFDIPDRPAPPGGPNRHAEATVVSHGYFQTMGIPMLMGQDFDGSERFGSPPVAIIDKTFADQFFPGENPVGKMLRGYLSNNTTIIGVAGIVDHDELGDAPKALAYYATAHQPWMTSRTIVVRSSDSVAATADALRATLAGIDPNIPLADLQTMDARIERWMGPRRLALLVLGAFSGLSLLLAALGVYGVLRYTTGQRTREIGVRMTLGARPGEVVGLVVRQGLVVALLGVGIGTAVAFGVTRLMTGLLFGVTPHDPGVFVFGAGVLMAVTVLASLLPAIAAARVDPVSALRAE